MIGYAATIAMRIIDGATISFARRRSGTPLERRRCWDAPADVTVAASMATSERRQRAVDRGVRLLERRLGRRPPRERVVDVLVDRLRDLRVHRRHRPRLGLAERLQELGRVR